MDTVNFSHSGSLPATNPQESLHTFCQAYTQEEVQEELWRCLQPRLLANLKEMNPDRADRIAMLHEGLISVVQAVYQLPAPPPTSPQNEGGPSHA